MDDEIIKERISAIENSIKFYSSSNKPERERWVVARFLENMNVPHDSTDIETPTEDPPDVVALGGTFEVKEILDPGRRRHQEYKDALNAAKNATTSKELLTEATPRDSSIKEIYELCKNSIKKLETKYPLEVRESLDILFYVNLQGVMDIMEHPYPDVTELRSSGWRSISFVEGDIACCFYVKAEAPHWLQRRAGTVHHKKW
ncbi:Putative endonuclease, protein of unknown function [Ectopseudomonas composti]|uniref:Uncharacterized protein n=1 Tax=Ectopseudomonas composti TaxID=658457 RepID=A0A1I5NS72_9GAMM|nr:DUF1780 domain-containing protein [Pseudomonas composti]SFP24480.1 Putative endonuclease, protein of unknown function [Pseudomonas composti]